MKTTTKLKNRQGGTVAVMVGISMVILIGFLAMVVDLGHLYVARTGLQNAADAAALSGAKQLDGTADGVCAASGSTCGANSAVNMAIDAAGRNTFFGSSGQSPIPTITIQFSASPTGPWSGVSAAQANPSNMYFIKVDTASGNISTWFAVIWNILDMSTYGTAVAGLEMTNVAPMGICAIAPSDTDGSDGSYFGFEQGVAYNMAKVNDLLLGIDKGTPLWLHPTATSSADCDPSFASNSKFAPFLCLGKSVAGESGYVYTNTGWEGALEDPLNTRFRKPGDPNNMTAQLCSPDINVKEFKVAQLTGQQCNPLYCSSFINSSACNGEALALCQWKAGACALKKAIPAGCSTPVDWLTPEPTLQAASGVTFDPASSVIASYDKPVDASQLARLNSNYPASGVGPYQTGINDHGKYYDAPYTAQGIPTTGRRLLNLQIVQCPSSGGGGGTCQEITRLGVGQFFMPVKAELTGLNKAVYLEFVKKTSLSAEAGKIRLYQ